MAKYDILYHNELLADAVTSQSQKSLSDAGQLFPLRVKRVTHVDSLASMQQLQGNLKGNHIQNYLHRPPAAQNYKTESRILEQQRKLLQTASVNSS